MNEIESTLKERNGTHGDYSDQAALCEALRYTMVGGKLWNVMMPTQRDALNMIAVKISRILTGNPNEPDHWHDIQGYALLVEKDLRSKIK